MAWNVDLLYTSLYPKSNPIMYISEPRTRWYTLFMYNCNFTELQQKVTWPTLFDLCNFFLHRNITSIYTYIHVVYDFRIEEKYIKLWIQSHRLKKKPTKLQDDIFEKCNCVLPEFNAKLLTAEFLYKNCKISSAAFENKLSEYMWELQVLNVNLYHLHESEDIFS